MHPLDRKPLRAPWRLRPQALAIVLGMAGGVATVVPAPGTYRSLENTRNAYYGLQRFAEVFATPKRAPAPVASGLRVLVIANRR